MMNWTGIGCTTVSAVDFPVPNQSSGKGRPNSRFPALNRPKFSNQNTARNIWLIYELTSMSHHQMHPQPGAGQRLPAPPGPGPSGPLGTMLAPPLPPSSSTNAGGGPLHGTSAVRPPPPPETALTRRLTDLLLLAPISLNLAEMTAADWRLIARLENETQLEQAARVHRCTVSCRGENLVALHCVQWNSMRCSFRLLYVRNKGDLFSQGQHNHAQTAPLWEFPMMPTTTRLPRPRIVPHQQAQALHGPSVVRPPPPEALTAQTQPILTSQSVTTPTSTSNEPSSANANDQQPKRRRNRKLGPEWRLVRQLTNESELRQLGFQPNGRRKKQYVDCPWGAPCQARLCLQKDQLTLYESGQHSHIRQPAATASDEGGPSGGTSSSSGAGGSISASRPAEAQMVEGQTGGVPQQHKSRKRRAKEDAKISDELMRQKQQQPLKMVISLGLNAEADDNAASKITMSTTTTQASSSCSSANNDNNDIVRNFLLSTSNNTNSSNGISRGEGGGSTVTMASSQLSARTTTTTSTTNCIVHNCQCQNNSNNQGIAVTNILGQLAPTPPLFNLILAEGQLPAMATTAISSSSSCSSSSDASTAANFFEPLTPENSVVGHHQQRTTESVQTQTSDGASTTAASATTTPRLLVTPFVPEIVIISSDDEEEEEEKLTKKGKESQGQQQSEAIGQVPVVPKGQAMGGEEHPTVGGSQTGQQIAAAGHVMLTGLGRGGERTAAVNIAHDEEPRNIGGATSQHQQQQQQVERVVPEAVESGGEQQGGVIVRNTVVAQEEQQGSSTAANAAALFAASSSSNVPTGRGELLSNANSNLARADQAVQAGPVDQQQPHHFHLFSLAELFRQVCWRFQMQFRVEGAKFVIKRVDPDQRIGDLLLFEDRGPLIVVTEYRERHSVQPDGRLLGQWVQKQSRWVKSDIEQFMTAVRGRCDQMLTSQPHLEP